MIDDLLADYHPEPPKSRSVTPPSAKPEIEPTKTEMIAPSSPKSETLAPKMNQHVENKPLPIEHPVIPEKQATNALVDGPKVVSNVGIPTVKEAKNPQAQVVSNVPSKQEIEPTAPNVTAPGTKSSTQVVSTNISQPAAPLSPNLSNVQKAKAGEVSGPPSSRVEKIEQPQTDVSKPKTAFKRYTGPLKPLPGAPEVKPPQRRSTSSFQRGQSQALTAGQQVKTNSRTPGKVPQTEVSDKTNEISSPSNAAPAIEAPRSSTTNQADSQMALRHKSPFVKNQELVEKSESKPELEKKKLVPKSGSISRTKSPFSVKELAAVAQDKGNVSKSTPSVNSKVEPEAKQSQQEFLPDDIDGNIRTNDNENKDRKRLSIKSKRSKSPFPTGAINVENDETYGEIIEASESLSRKIRSHSPFLEVKESTSSRSSI